MAGGMGTKDYAAGWFDTWAGKVLEGLGDPKTPENIKSLHAWAQAEGSDAYYNPLNTTLPEPGASKFNSIGVRNYASLDQGVQATDDTLQSRGGSRYGAILSDLRSGQGVRSPEALKQMSVWGTNPKLYAKIDGGTYNPGTTDTGKPTGSKQSLWDLILFGPEFKGQHFDTGILNSIQDVNDVKTALNVGILKPLLWLIAPNNITRVVLFILGVIFILLGFFFLAKDMTG